MKFDKDFNPGQGNTYNEWNIQHVENFNPNATTVTTTHNHYGEEKVRPNGRQKMEDTEKEAIKNDVLNYVGQLTENVKQEWKAKYATLWKNILNLPEVEAKVMEYGKQKNTTFNKYVVGNIIHMLIGKVLDGDPTNLCRVLEGTEKHQIRQEMGTDPSEDIQKKVLALLV